MSEQNPEPDEPETNPDAEPPLEPIEPDDDDQEREPEQAKPTGPSTEAKMQAADKANRAYHKKLDQILGPDEARHECHTCNGLGVEWGEPEELPDLLFAEDTEACQGCNALGFVKTGSLNPEQATMPHSACGGRGWITKVAPMAPVTTITAGAPVAGQVLQGQYVPGKGFVPYGADEALPGTLGA